MACGCVDERQRLLLAASSYRSTFDEFGCRKQSAPLQESAVVGAYLADVDLSAALARGGMGPSAPYRRETYFAERISQWRGHEPAIPDDDFSLIKARYWEFTGQWPSPKQRWARNHVLSKDDCRALLWDLDNERASYTYFVKKYLEKFLSIRYMLTGHGSRGRKVSDGFVHKLKVLFSRLQPAFAHTVRASRERYSFVNYNFCFRRLFDLLGKPYLARDFPPLKSRKKREDIIFLWLKLIKYLKWPYINSDAANFGNEFRADLAAIVARRTRHASHADGSDSHSPHARSEPDASGSDCELRRGSDDDPCSSRSRGAFDQILSDVHAAFNRSPDRGDCGFGDGFDKWFWVS